MSYLAILQAESARQDFIKTVARAHRYSQLAVEARADGDYHWAEQMQWLADSQRRIAALRAEREPIEIRRAA